MAPRKGGVAARQPLITELAIDRESVSAPAQNLVLLRRPSAKKD